MPWHSGMWTGGLVLAMHPPPTWRPKWAGVYRKRGGGGVGRTPPPPMAPATPAPKAPEKSSELKSSCAKGAEENFASNSGRGGGGGGPGRGDPLLIWLSAVLVHPWSAGGLKGSACAPLVFPGLHTALGFQEEIVCIACPQTRGPGWWWFAGCPNPPFYRRGGWRPKPAAPIGRSPPTLVLSCNPCSP